MLRTFDELSTTEAEGEKNEVDKIAEMAENNYTVDFPSLINRINSLEAAVDRLENKSISETNTADNPINGIDETDSNEEDKE